MDVGGAAPCLFLVIGFIFMVTAPYNWHETLLTNACTAEVPLDQANVKPLFGMLTHAAFFIGELNWGMASVHLMNWLGFEPALAAAPVEGARRAAEAPADHGLRRLLQGHEADARVLSLLRRGFQGDLREMGGDGPRGPRALRGPRRRADEEEARRVRGRGRRGAVLDRPVTS